MPSTYSNLKIQLMATGENATTWGNVTNVNLGTAIEEAIVGSADVTFASNNQTLTLTDNNSSQTARNMRLRCTGTTGGSTRNLVVPSIEKPYIVQNDCADSVVVKTSAGTGITVPAGKTMWVYSDATNVVDVANHLTSLTLDTALAVAQGGTGTATLTGVVIGNGTSAFTAKTNPTGAFVGTTDTQTLTNKTIEGAVLNNGYTEEVFAVVDGAGAVLDPNNGSIQTWTLGANRTPTQANWAAGQSITLMLNETVSGYTVTWTTLGVVWVGGTAPSLAPTGGFTVITLWKVGTTIYGALVGQVA